MLVTNTTASDRVSFYETNFEHASSQTNMQVHNAVGETNLYSFKSENTQGEIAAVSNPRRASTLWISDSLNVNVYGHGGNAFASTSVANALYLLENVSNIRITNIVPQHEWARNTSGSAIFDQTVDVRTPKCSRPVLYLVP